MCAAPAEESLSLRRCFPLLPESVDPAVAVELLADPLDASGARCLPMLDAAVVVLAAVAVPDLVVASSLVLCRPDGLPSSALAEVLPVAELVAWSVDEVGVGDVGDVVALVESVDFVSVVEDFALAAVLVSSLVCAVLTGGVAAVEVTAALAVVGAVVAASATVVDAAGTAVAASALATPAAPVISVPTALKAAATAFAERFSAVMTVPARLWGREAMNPGAPSIVSTPEARVPAPLMNAAATFAAAMVPGALAMTPVGPIVKEPLPKSSTKLVLGAASAMICELST